MRLPPSTEPHAGPGQLRSSQPAALSVCEGLAGLRKPQLGGRHWGGPTVGPGQGIPSTASGTLEHQKGLSATRYQALDMCLAWYQALDVGLAWNWFC